MSQQQAEYEASQFTLCPLPLDFRSNLCHTNSMTHERQHLISALSHEYDFLCHDSYDPDDMTSEQYLEYLHTLSNDELITESSTDDTYTLDEYITHWL